jgi:Sec-independent protein translocase protein TatA
MRSRIISICLLGFAFLFAARAQTTAAEDKGPTTANTKKTTKTTEAKDTEQPAAPNATTNPPATPAPSSTSASADQAASSVNSLTGLMWFVVAVGIAVIVLLIILLYLGIPGKLQEMQKSLTDLTGTIGHIKDKVNQIHTALGAPAANTTVAGNIQTLQTAVGTPQAGATVVQTIGQAAQAAAVTQALTQLQTTLNQALQEIALVRGTSDVVLTQAWNRLAPGLPPPFAPRIDRIGTPGANGLATIDGRNFTQDCRIWFGVRDARPEPGATANRMNVRPPAGQSGTVDVCVQSTNGLVSSPSSFTYPAQAGAEW